MNKKQQEEYTNVLIELEEIRRKRDSIEGNAKFLIDTILPSAEFHIIAGPSGVGKTTWFLPLLKDWTEGKPVLGFASNPVPYVYISCDRSLKALNRTLARIGLSDWNILAYSIEDLEGFLRKYHIVEEDELTGEESRITYDQLKLEHLPSMFEFMGIKVFVVEGYSWFMESSNNKNAYRDTMRLGSKIRHAYDKKGCSLIVTTHVPKMKKGEGYANPRERIIGSVGQAAVASTVILLESGDESDVTDPNRIVTICPRDSKAIVKSYELDDVGRYVLSAQQDVKPKERRGLLLLDEKLKGEGVQNLIPTGILEGWADECKISRATLFRWIQTKETDGEIEKCGRALYKRVTRKLV